MKKPLLLVLAGVFLCSLFSSNLLSQIQVGEYVTETYETSHPYQGKGGVVWEQTFHWPEASYISIHFSQFDLAPSDYVEISSPDGQYVYKYDDKGKLVRQGKERISEFWAIHIPGDTAEVKLYSKGNKNGWGFVIDKWARGYESDIIRAAFAQLEGDDVGLEAICGTDDKEWAPCYDGTTMYNEARAVCRLLINGSSACTGWLLGSEGHVMTNNHCISTQSSADNTDYEFMAEGATCSTSCAGWMACPGTVEAGSGDMIQTDSNLDFTLILLPTNVTSTYGYMQLRDTLPIIDERIYIPQHPGAYGKQIAVYSTHSTDASGYCEVYSTDETPCMGGPGDIGYYADTAGGSSGSPVLAYTDHLVVSLHHCADCPNRGVPIPSIISDLGANIPDDAVGGGPVNPPVADFTSNTTSVMVGGSVNFTDQSTNNPTSWSWMFDGGTPGTSTAQNPTITYNSPGVYTVSLTATNDAGSDTETKVDYITVTALQPPVADFSASSTSISVGDSVTFTDQSLNSPTSWEWTFEGGTPGTSTAQNPTITYNSMGTFTVTLTATNAAGSDTETKVDYINVAEQPYCTSSAGNQGYEYIAGVAVADLDNDSGASPYSDFTNLTAHVTQDQTVNVSLTPGFPGSSYTEYWKIWIDYNGDHDFEDSGEEVFSGSGSSVVTGSFTVPAAAPLGDTRMRVSMSYSTYPPMCGTFTYGEVEDYTVNISGVGQQYTLTTNTVGQGSIDLNPAGGTYPDGTVVTLTAIPDSGWQFDGWSGDLTGTANPAAITMDADKSVTATFSEVVLPQYTLTVTTAGQGGVSLDPPGGTYDEGTVVTLTAAPDSGWQFDGWSGDLSGTQNPATLTMNANKNVTATFSEVTTTDTVGNTTVFGNTSVSDYRRAMPFTMPENGTISSVAIYHEGGSGSLILGVYGGEGTPQSRLGVTSATVINSSAGWQTINLTAPAYVTGGATVWLAWVFENNPGIAYQTGSPGRYQSSATWSGGMPDPFGSGSQTNYIYSIYANYTPSAPPQYTLTANTVGQGSVTLDPTGGTYDSGTVVTLTATPDSGWQFDGWSGDLSGTANPATLTMTSDKSVTATFSEIGATGTVGYTTVFGSTSVSDYRRAMPFTMLEDGVITSVSMYHTGGSGNMILAVYDGETTPQNRLAVTASTPVSGSTGWQTVNLQGSVAVQAGVTVWLAWVYEDNPGIRYQTGSPGRYQSSSTWSGGMPDPFGSGSQTDYIYSIYATYNK